MSHSKEAIAILLLTIAIILWAFVIGFYKLLPLPDFLKAREQKPIITSLIEADATLGQARRLDDLEVVFGSLEKENIAAGEEFTLFWDIREAGRRNTASLDLTMHNSAIHFYAIHKDLGGPLIHLHPTINSKTGLWEHKTQLPAFGEWYALSQFTRGNTLYQLTSRLFAGGDKKEKPFIPSFSREMKREERTIRLEAENPLYKGIPASLRFVFDRKEDFSIINSNLIFALKESPFIWNEHGDGSVRKVSGEAGFSVSPALIEGTSISYEVTFPEKGTWLVVLELLNDPIRFYLPVEA